MKIRSLSVIALAAFAIPSAHAAIAFNNFGPGDAFLTDVGYALRGAGSDPNYLIQGFGFNAAFSGQVSLIKLAVSFISGPDRTMTIRLFDGTPGSVGSLMKAWTITATTNFGDGGTETIVNSDPLTTLTAGQDYWLTAEAAPNSEDTWCRNSIGDLGPHALTTNGGNSYSYNTDFPAGAYRVEVVPEPASLAVLGLGALALIRRRRSRKA